LKRLWLLAAALLSIPAMAQNVFKCGPGSTAWTSTAGSNCTVVWAGSGNQGFYVNSAAGGSISGGIINFVPGGAGHLGNGMWFQSTVNVQAFTATFTFVPNGYNFAFAINNDTVQNPQTLSAGAGGEMGFYQGFYNSSPAPGPGYVNNIFALGFDQFYGPTTGTFSYSNVQLYQAAQTPFVPSGTGASGQLAYFNIDKISTSPVPLNSPATTPATTTGDTYSATINYSGNVLTLALYDVTAGGTCTPTSSATCFYNTWNGVYIPGIVGSNTGYVGFTAGTDGTTDPLIIKTFSYTVNSPTSGTGLTAYNANSTYNTGSGTASSSPSPVYSVAPGTYSGTQSVAIATSGTPHNYICYTTSTSYPSPTPQPDNQGGCAAGTLYTGPVSISSSTTLYAMAGSNNDAFGCCTGGSPSGLGPTSTLVAGTYTITGGGAASTPTFSPVAGTYTGTQSVTLSTSSSGAVICYNTTGSPATNGSTGCTAGTVYSSAVSVPSSETLYAVAGGTGYTDSSVGSAAYTINTSTPPAKFSGKVTVSGKVVVQ
jgi:Chitobiase/beta-hexosaminidase C-terminal domain